MSVLSCDRNSCDQIMCDSYSSTYGYICRYCLTELEETGGALSISDFMDTEKGSITTEPRDDWVAVVGEEFITRG